MSSHTAKYPIPGMAILGLTTLSPVEIFLEKSTIEGTSTDCSEGEQEITHFKDRMKNAEDTLLVHEKQLGHLIKKFDGLPDLFQKH